MKVKVLYPFFDVQEQVNRQRGEVFECSEQRYTDIASKLGEGWLEVVERPQKRKKGIYERVRD